MGALFACAVVFCTIIFTANEVGGGVATGGIYVVVFEIVAHFDPIGIGIGMRTSRNRKMSIDSMGLGEPTVIKREDVEIHLDIVNWKQSERGRWGDSRRTYEQLRWH